MRRQYLLHYIYGSSMPCVLNHQVILLGVFSLHAFCSNFLWESAATFLCSCQRLRHPWGQKNETEGSNAQLDIQTISWSLAKSWYCDFFKQEVLLNTEFTDVSGCVRHVAGVVLVPFIACWITALIYKIYKMRIFPRKCCPQPCFLWWRHIEGR